MAQLVPMRLEDGTEIYIEATENVDVPPAATFDDDLEEGESYRGGAKGGSAVEIASQSFKAIESTIRTYTTHTLSAFKDMAYADVKKVTLQFGIRIGGEAGVPYVTKGTAESNLSITVECAFNKD